MPIREVTRSRRDSDGDIIALCNHAASWSPRSELDVIRDIESGVHRYYVLAGSQRSFIRVADGPTGKYLRTDPDTSSIGELDNLPYC